MTFANQRFFDRAGERLVAQGFDWKDDLRAQAGLPRNGQNGGIDNPQEVRLKSGTILVRFGGGAFPFFSLNSGWWLTLDEYLKVQGFADQKGISIPEAVRRTCCVPPEWSQMDVRYQAQLQQPLLAYAGLGRPAQTNAAVWARELDVTQLYIPGMTSGDVVRDSMVWKHNSLPTEVLYRVTSRP
ncbi:MAG: hypothetical protein ABW023_00385 [Sphingomonas sp.]